MIQDQEWFKGHNKAVLGEIKGEVMNDPLMGFDSFYYHPKHPPGPENTRKWLWKKIGGRIPLPMVETALKADITRREGRRPDSTLRGQDSLEGGCRVETGFMGVPWMGTLDAPVVKARLIGFIGTWFHGRLGKGEDSSVLSHVGWGDVHGLGRTDHDRDPYDLALLEVARNIAEDFPKVLGLWGWLAE
ncbi:hypothetical protein F2Q69_00059334 [Brassica cretica]|uniref:Uncharacterized protein n=1 Tax=Brassica cretica TaxID=69181 RepID=A0A8S9RF83_BRACR|nr:hypothetical protein F2Q69_00059334 [Brassica cretica]